MTLMQRGNIYYLRRNVPKRYASVEPRREVWITLKTDSQSEARRRAIGAWDQAVLRWEAMLQGDDGDAAARYDAAKEVARTHGFRFLPADRVAQLPLHEIVDRMEATMMPSGSMNPHLVAGILGTAQPPKLTLSKALEIYWQLSRDKLQGKSEDQIRRLKNPRIKAFKNLIAHTGDAPLDDLTSDDMLGFRDWWWAKITEEELTPNSGNKDFSYIASTLRLVNKMKRLGLQLPLDGLNFAEPDKVSRSPFSETWIKEKILSPGVLDGLNTEARCILLGMVNTGYRPSEAQGLRAVDIRLDTNLPHISIEPVGRTLKNASLRRVIPLAGISLEAFRACPGGFPRYAGKAGLSATVNKYLRENGLMQTEGHSLYGLRHSFEDRLLDRGVDERIRRDLMGHALSRERYGQGASPERLAEVVQSIAL